MGYGRSYSAAPAQRTGPRAASLNAARVTRLLTEWRGSAVLYRTVVAGPSGQRADLPVGRVRYCWDDCGPAAGWELEVCSPRTREVCGFLSRDTGRRPGTWLVRSYCDDIADYEFNRLLGWASSAALGADVLVNGVHAATGRHDSQRISRGTFLACPGLAQPHITSSGPVTG